MKECTKCCRELPESEFYADKAATSGFRSECKHCQRLYRRDSEQKMTYEIYRQIHEFDAVEYYMIEKLSEKPTLSAGLDAMYRRDPRRWHQVLMASTLRRRDLTA